MTQRFFGSEDEPLLGIYHPPRGKAATPARSVVICSPIGQEFIRTHMAIRLLARQLARKGMHVLRFDYRGMGDSARELESVDRLGVWEEDICEAIGHLREVSRSPQVSLLGLRAGASLAQRVAMQSDHVHSLLLWEPVLEGARYLSSLRDMHREMLDLWVCKMKTVNDSQHEEILGSIFARPLLDEIESLRFDLSKIQQPHAVVATTASMPQPNHQEPSLQKIIAVDDAESWDDLQELETAWLRSSTSRTVVATMQDMFDRLDKFGVLSGSAQIGQQNVAPISAPIAAVVPTVAPGPGALL